MKRFKKVYIEITNTCNLSCNFCPKTKRELKFMDVNDFTHIINSIKPYTDYIYFHLMGEPLLNPGLQQFLKISEDNELKVNLTTNGTLIKGVKEMLIASPALRQVNFSLGSFEANVQSDNLSLSRYIEEILDFILEANKKSSIICSLRLWNLDSAELKGSNEANEQILSLLETRLGLDFKIAEKLEKSHRLKLRNNLYLNAAEKFDWPDIDKETTDEKLFCYGLRDQIGILVDGTVVPCCLDSEGSIKLGNLFDSSLEEILNSERAKRLYEGFSRRCAVEELCKRCGYAKRYK